jgi:hypothetical protein
LAGISFPFRTEGAGLPKDAKGTEVVKSALTLLLRTPRGSRVMRPTLGTDLHKLIFEDVGPFLNALVQRDILLAVADWLPEVEVLAIDVVEKDRGIEVNIQYRILGVVDEVTVDIDRG